MVHNIVLERYTLKHTHTHIQLYRVHSLWTDRQMAQLSKWQLDGHNLQI